ncbi:MAG: sulfotransferase family 2 domain-containing protein [Pseudomonadota bacterium]
MTAHLTDFKVSYFSVPKCACTSIKSMLFEAENGFEWRDFKANGQIHYVHSVYKSLPHEKTMRQCPEDHWKFAVLREPVSRLISCYKNRFMSGRGRKQINAKLEKVAELGLEARPDFDGFVTHFEAYCDLAPDVRAHAVPTTRFLGEDAEYFDRIYTIKQLDEMRSDLKVRVPELPEMPHLQTRGKDVPVAAPSKDSVARIEEIYARDYDIYSAFF